jgi:hypothetical protein
VRVLSFDDRSSLQPHETPRLGSGQRDRVSLELFDDRPPFARELCELLLADFRDAGVIAGPALDRDGELVKLRALGGVFGFDARRPHDMQIDVTARVTLAPGRRAEHRRMDRRHLPLGNGSAQPAEQLASRECPTHPRRVLRAARRYQPKARRSRMATSARCDRRSTGFMCCRWRRSAAARSSSTSTPGR